MPATATINPTPKATTRADAKAASENAPADRQTAARLLQKHFDALAETPGAVEKLRELILSLAFRGELLQRGEATPTRGQEPLSAPKPSLFSMPIHWRWAVLSDIAKNCGQKTPNQRFTYIDVGSIENRRGTISTDLQVLEASEAPSRARKLVRKGTVIFSTVRPYLRNIDTGRNPGNRYWPVPARNLANS